MNTSSSSDGPVPSAFSDPRLDSPVSLSARAVPPGAGLRQWYKRHNLASETYARIPPLSQEWVEAIANGLTEWAALVPQCDWKANGTPIPANKWGLKPEATAIRSLVVCMELVGNGQARWLHNEMEALRETAKELDACLAASTAEQESIERLSSVAVEQATVLACLVRRVGRRLSLDGEERGASGVTRYRLNAPARRRGAPTRRSLCEDLRLVKAWQAARGKAGMSRRQFCQSRGVSLEEFIRAQDNARKHHAPAVAE